MTTYKGIAVATQALGYRIGAAAKGAVEEAVVTYARPEDPSAGAPTQPRVNVYLVQVVPAVTMRHQDLPTRDANGLLLQSPHAPVTLRYLLSFFGPSVQAQLMLGATELVLREQAILDRTLIGKALAGQPDLWHSGLEDQVPPVRVVPSAITIEELSRLWSGFLPMPYTLSTLYEASAVILTGAETPAGGPPVRGVNDLVGPMAPQLGPLPTVQFSSAGTPVPVSGSGLHAGQCVEVGGDWAALEPDAEGGWRFTLPPTARAGPQTVQLGVSSGGAQPTVIPGSRPEVLRVRPAILRVRASGSAVTVRVVPTLHAGQEAVLNLVGVARSPAPPASAEIAVTVPQTTEQLEFKVPAQLTAGRYLASLEVDGVASLPVVVQR